MTTSSKLPSQYPTLPEAVEAFLRELVAKSPETLKTYRSALNRFDEFLRDSEMDPKTMTTESLSATVLEEFYTWLLSVYGRERRITAIKNIAGARAFVRFLDHRSWLAPELSYERMKDRLRELVGRVPYRTPRVSNEISSIIVYVNTFGVPVATPDNKQARLTLLRDKAVLNTLYSTGLRRAEVSRLNRSDIDDGRSSEAIITGKGDKERVVFFDEVALASIREYLSARGDSYLPLFIRHDDGRGKPGHRGERWRLSAQSIWGVVKRYARLSGVEGTTHHLRHLKARTLLNAGAQLSEVQDILGHASPDTTKRIYAQYSRQHLREAFDRFSRSAEDVASELGED